MFTARDWRKKLPELQDEQASGERIILLSGVITLGDLNEDKQQRKPQA